MDGNGFFGLTKADSEWIAAQAHAEQITRNAEQAFSDESKEILKDLGLAALGVATVVGAIALARRGNFAGLSNLGERLEEEEGSLLAGKLEKGTLDFSGIEEKGFLRRNE